MPDVITICCVGDSNTFGYDPRDPLEMRYPEEVRWTDRIRGDGRTVINMGMNGMTVPTEPSFHRIPQWIGGYRTKKLVIIMLGSNDLLEHATAGETAEKMKAFLAKLLEDNPAETILLLAPPVFQPGEWIEGEDMIGESRKLAGEYRALAAELKIRFADTGEWGIGLVYDGVHFSPEGHRVFADRLKELL